MCIGMVGVADDGLVVAVLHSLVDFAVEGDGLGTTLLTVPVGEREYFVPEGYACWIPRGTVHALTSHNRRISLRIFYFLSESDTKVADDVFSVHYVCPWATANFRFIAGYGPGITKDDSGLLGFCLSFFHTFRKEERKIELPLRGIDATLLPTLR